MSLDELLKDADPSSRWGIEKRKLRRLGLAVLGVAIVFVSAAGMIFLIRKTVPTRAPADESEDLARLMSMRVETERLQNQIEEMRTAKPSHSSRRAVAGSGANKGLVLNYDPGEGFATVTPDKSELYIPTGAVFQARLITPIKTSVQRTFVMAETTNEFRMDMKRRIPARSRLIGRSRLDPVLKGVVVEFETLVLPNGIETSLSGLALSRNALPEIEGLYFSNDLQNYGAALAFGFLSGFAGGARDREPTIFGSQPEVSLGNQVLAGLSTASFQVAEDILSDIRNRSIEYVVVPAGERVFVALVRRYDLRTGRPN